MKYLVYILSTVFCICVGMLPRRDLYKNIDFYWSRIHEK